MSIRAFIAIPLPEEVKRAIHSLGKELVEKGLRLRLVRPEGIHCTIRFLGNIEENQVDAISQAMEKAAEKTKSSRLSTAGLGVFPNPLRARVIWVGIEGDLAPINTIFNSLQDELEAIGFEREKRGFSPHLTIGRWKNPLNSAEKGILQRVLEEHKSWRGGEFDVKEIVLYLSQLHPSGARYTPLRRIPID